jgi:two-component system cell cycle sensor histidine kinase/response regulator CckA
VPALGAVPAQAERAEPLAELEDLRAAELRYRTLVEGLPLATYVVDLDLRFAYASPQLRALAGLEPGAEVEDEDGWSGLVHPEDRERFAQERRDWRSDGAQQPLSSEYRLLRSDRGTVWVSETAVAVRDASGAVQHFQGSLQDVTERRQADAERFELEEKLRQGQRVEAVGRLAGGIAHDFNNLLTAILGYGDLLHAKLDGHELLRGEVDGIRKAAERAASLTRQLLAFSRRQVLNPTVLNLNAVVGDMEKMLQRMIGEDVELVTRFDPLLGSVKADRGQIEQVLMNLVVNARDAMADGGRLVIETANVVLDEGYAARHVAAEPGSYALLSVTDSGAGMDDETHRRAFEPFFTTKEPTKGTGLGLSTVYGIVKQSGGYVWLYSEPGSGTTVKVYLPLVDEPAAEERPVSPPAAALSAGASETILLVEDEEIVRSLARTTLEAAGYHVIEAGSGEEALLLAREPAEIDLLLTDVVMPGMNGRELAQHVTATRPGLSVLYTSGYSEEAITHQLPLDPRAAFLEKPFTAYALTRTVRDVLDSADA